MNYRQAFIMALTFAASMTTLMAVVLLVAAMSEKGVCV